MTSEDICGCHTGGAPSMKRLVARDAALHATVPSVATHRKLLVRCQPSLNKALSPLQMTPQRLGCTVRHSGTLVRR